MTATALLLVLPLSGYCWHLRRAASIRLQRMRAIPDGRKERAYVNHDIYHTCKFLREYTDYPAGMQPPASYDRSARPAHLHDI